MRIILTADVKDIGQKGDEKEVKPGFGRNFLLPRGLAVSAESDAGKKIIAEIEAEKVKKKDENKKVENTLAGQQNLEIAFKRKINGKKLFAGVKPAEILSEIEKKVGFKPTKIKPSTAIKEIGSHDIVAIFAGGKTLNLKVIVEAEK